mmetsp:Transcript_57096/g.105567  ORF Transcript_57096/g.105567 Transcript_57096/m.105567 type:complete len:252 (+) Transcript_57096:124-879(+)
MSAQIATCSAIRDSLPPHAFSGAELEQLLRNFRLRKRVGCLPDQPLDVSDHDEQCLSALWLRYRWRAVLTSSYDGGAAVAEVDDAVRREAEQHLRASESERLVALTAEVNDLQQQVEKRCRELNAERRNRSALAEGLRKQQESMASIASETERLQEELLRAQQEVQERTAANVKLSTQLGLAREKRARKLTQAAVLETAISQLDQRDTADDLEFCRAQIRAVLKENESMELQLREKRFANAGISNLLSGKS